VICPELSGQQICGSFTLRAAFLCTRCESVAGSAPDPRSLANYIGYWAAANVNSNGTVTNAQMVDAFESCNAGAAAYGFYQSAYGGCGSEPFSSGDLAGLKGMDALGQLMGLPGGAVELAQDTRRSLGEGLALRR
jgi:hypothetical protein